MSTPVNNKPVTTQQVPNGWHLARVCQQGKASPVSKPPANTTTNTPQNNQNQNKNPTPTQPSSNTPAKPATGNPVPSGPSGAPPPPPPGPPAPVVPMYEYRYDTNHQGDGVDAYIFDSGVNMIGSEFDSTRLHIDSEFNCFVGIDLSKLTDEEKKSKDDDVKNGDFNGHGTRMASLIAGNQYGVAKKTQMISVKVTNNVKKGNPITIEKGINKVLEQVKKTKKPSIVCLAMGDSYAAKWMKVTIGVAKLIMEGIHVVNSAGNHGGSTNGRIWTPSYDDLKGTPGIEKELDFLGDKFKNNLDGGLKELLRLLGLIIVVGAMNIDDTLCDFSGYGSRVDILAPGLDVYAMNNDGKPNKQFGASEATAIVTGLLASSISGTLYQNKQKNVKDGDTLSLEYQKKALLANGTQVAIISDEKSARSDAEKKERAATTKVIATNGVWKS